MEQAVGFVEFMGFFFSWWAFWLGVVLTAPLATLGALWLAPVVYRAKRRRELRRMWRMDVPRPFSESVLPHWAEYVIDETVDRRCVCHGRRIYEGEWVLMWPEVGPLGILHTAVYCPSVKESV